MKKIIYIIPIIILSFCINACTKAVDTTTTTTDTTATTPSNVVPKIKLFNVMDYGNVVIKLNSTTQKEVALYYPTDYLNGVIGTNRIYVTFNGAKALDVGVDLLANKNYSGFIYRIGYNWKLSLVPDDLTTPSSGYAKVRVLDFRTQAYFDYIHIKFSSLGSVDTLRYSYRNFLDHQSFDTFTKFDSLRAGKYNAVIFNDSINLANKTGLQLVDQKIYSLILGSKSSQLPAQAIYYISMDWKNNN